MRASLILAGLVAAIPAWAAEGPAFHSPHATVSLVSETDGIAPGRPVRLALRFVLQPGWHIYWSNPGDAGAPPELALNLPPGSTATGLSWPVPQRLAEGDLTTYGYTGAVTLPFTLTPGTAPLALDADANWLVCERVCVPEQARLHLDLAAGPAMPAAEAPLFAAARLPVASPFAATIAPDGTLDLVAPGLSPRSVAGARFLPGADGMTERAEPARIREGGLSLALHPGQGFDAAKPLPGVLVLTDPAGGDSALQLTAQPGPAAASGTAWPLLLALALAGGVLLNLMPCVFPVLAMKALGLARLSGASRRAVRTEALAYSAGVVLAFAGLGGVMLALRGAGSLAGWGFQFQSPGFVAATAWLLFGVGLSLSGVVRLEGSWAGAGQGLASRGGWLGSLFTGLLAVVVASPCTAPFMGVAVAGGLAAPAPVCLAVFAAMGIGLAAPTLLLAAAPGLAALLPRPGRWMDVLQGALAFPMYAACLWLVWVASQQAGPAGVLAAGAGLLLVGFAAWALRAGAGRIWGRAGAVLAVIGALALLPAIAALPPAATTAQPGGLAAEPFSAARLAILRTEGRPVFVDMTAAWCVTCLVNEQVALAPRAVQDAFAARNVAYLRGDWTRQDAAITAFLRDHGRDGVPLYVFYPPGDGPGEVLPQVLTPATVLARLRP